MKRNPVLDHDVEVFVKTMAQMYNNALSSLLCQDPIGLLPHLETIHFVGSNIAGIMMNYLTDVTHEEWDQLIGDPMEKLSAMLNKET